jgi:hypothetical protein
MSYEYYFENAAGICPGVAADSSYRAWETALNNNRPLNGLEQLTHNRSSLILGKLRSDHHIFQSPAPDSHPQGVFNDLRADSACWSQPWRG